MDRVRLHLRVLSMGTDICLALDGGDRPHIGAVAMAHDGRGECLTLPGHKETMLAQRLALRAHAALGVTVTVVCGIHLDQISKAEIALVDVVADALLDEFLQGENLC